MRVTDTENKLANAADGKENRKRNGLGHRIADGTKPKRNRLHIEEIVR